MTPSAYIVAAARTSVVPSGGALRDLDFDVLAAAPIKACLTRAGADPGQVDELILSNALGAGGNPARLASLASGLPHAVAGLSIDRQCVGGLDAIILAQALIESGQAHAVLAGGSESHSLRPQRHYRTGWNAELRLREQARFTPWTDRDPDMTEAASRLADEEGITLESQNAWAVASHAKARAARQALSAEIVNPGGVDLDRDPFTRPLSLKTCARAPGITGTITTANTSVAADGAAFVLVVSRQVLDRLKLAFALRVVTGATVGGDPELPAIAPVRAIEWVLKQAQMDSNSFAVIELMEAYAAQAIVCARGAGLNADVINPGGGSLARGHPIGASGTILAVRLFHELRQRRGLGLAAIAAAGGLGSALIVESVSP
jgi:acetyl-CoA C-acetyltransferase